MATSTASQTCPPASRNSLLLSGDAFKGKAEGVRRGCGGADYLLYKYDSFKWLIPLVHLLLKHPIYLQPLSHISNTKEHENYSGYFLAIAFNNLRLLTRYHPSTQLNLERISKYRMNLTSTISSVPKTTTMYLEISKAEVSKVRACPPCRSRDCDYLVPT